MTIMITKSDIFGKQFLFYKSGQINRTGIENPLYNFFFNR